MKIKKDKKSKKSQKRNDYNRNKKIEERKWPLKVHGKRKQKQKGSNKERKEQTK